MSKRKVAILGATGTVGQRFVQLLDGHPWFEISALTGSSRTANSHYGETCNWVLPGDMPDWARGMVVQDTAPDLDAEIVFSALPSGQAKEFEPSFAQAGYQVFSNASAHRTWEDVPLIIPEVNAHHADLVLAQREKRGWSGCLVTSCNCTSTGLTVSLRPLLDTFGIKQVFVVSMQALSGAGYPGVSSLDILGNVVPYIGGEEEKVESEPLKMLGNLGEGGIDYADFAISAHTNRVPVIDGHLVCVSVSLEQNTTPEQAIAAWESFAPPEVVRSLPSSPEKTFIVRREPDRPQPRRDRQSGKGMSTVIGRVRPDPIFDLRYVALSHNTLKGAAGGSLQNAELLHAQGII
jgi:aspartate-semialdehyde dehydrogenase